MQATNPAADPLNHGDPANDDIILSVPVLATPRPPIRLSRSGADDDNPSSGSKRRFSLFKRKPSATGKERKSSNVDDSKPIMKDMTRTEYLKYYALDGYGRYVGSEDPAPDCILKDASDIAKYKMPPEYRAALGDTNSLQLNSPLMVGGSAAMGMGIGAAGGGF